MSTRYFTAKSGRNYRVNGQVVEERGWRHDPIITLAMLEASPDAIETDKDGVPLPPPSPTPGWHPPFEHGWIYFWKPVNHLLSGWVRCRSGQIFQWHIPDGFHPHEGKWSFAGMYSEPYGEGWMQVFPPRKEVPHE